jgi:hypothetical protein
MKRLLLTLTAALSLVNCAHAQATLEEVASPVDAKQFLTDLYQKMGKSDNVTVVECSGFVDRNIAGYDYLIAKAYVTVHSQGIQVVMGVVIDHVGNWTQVMTESDFHAFLRTGNRFYLHEPNLDPSS